MEHRALDGEGARLYGGRWNSEGGAVVYASATLSLAALEYLVHVDIAEVPADLVALGIEVPEDAAAAVLGVADLPPDWKRPDAAGSAAVGDAWVAEGASLTLAVPSAIVPEENNVLINPRHGRAADVRIASERPFAYDPRLL